MTTKPKRVIVAINPTASFGASRDVGPAVVQTLRAMGHEVTSLTEPDFESLLEVAHTALRSRPDALVVVGGDGMVNLGVNLLAGTRVPPASCPREPATTWRAASASRTTTPRRRSGCWARVCRHRRA
jgi:diacylglycerol kinase (ATP)